jgi:2-oxopent-4-enoate/cis-2-oxohex-4-enoate hydratase
MATIDLTALSDELYAALQQQKTVAPLTARVPGITIDDAYKISLAFLQRRLKDGERVVGKKIGVTSKPVQDMLDVREPDFGFLTDVMEVPNGGTVEISKSLIQPRAEAEIGIILAKDIKGPGVTAEDVLEATESIAACFEIVDSRITDWKIRIQDTVADNASCGVFVLGNERVNPRGLDLANLKATVTKNGKFLSEGLGSAVQGSPLASTAWLANTLGSYGVALSAGDVNLSGSLVPLEPASPGDEFHMELSDVGSCTVRFS